MIGPRPIDTVGYSQKSGISRGCGYDDRPTASDLAPEVIEIVLGEPAFEERTGVDAGCGVALDVDRVAGLAVVLAAEEVVEADLVEAGARRERRQVTADAVGVLVRLDDHGRGVPPDERADAALDQLVTGEPRLALGRDRVDVRRAHGGGEADLQLARPLEKLADQEPGPGLAVHLDDAVEAVEPLLRLLGVDVGQLVHEPVEDHAPILHPRLTVRVRHV